MLIHPTMLAPAAEEAGMKVPPDPKNLDKKEFPHFHAFCVLQLCRPMNWNEHWDNAEVIAKIPEEELKKMTLEQFLKKGVRMKGF